MKNEGLIEKRKKEICSLVESFDNELHLKMIIEILKSMLSMIKKGQLQD